MTELNCILFQSLGLPCAEKGKKLPANYNALTKKVDGTTDSNLDGKVDKSDRNGFVEPEELFQEVFSNRRAYRLVIQKLYRAGLEDPFEERDEIKDFVKGLFEKYNPKTQLAKAILLVRSVIPPTAKFKMGKTTYSGFTVEEGGLAIPFNKDFTAPLRKKFGDLLPKELINASQEERVAFCLEYSHLLVSLLRAAGLEAHTKGEPEHAYVIAILDGRKYKLDAAKLLFKPTINGAHSDRESIAMHYSNEGVVLVLQGKLDEAIRAFDRALEINPNYAAAWNNKGVILNNQWKLDEAIRAFDRALGINPNCAAAWHGKGFALSKQGELDEAIKVFNRCLRINPNDADAWHGKGIVLAKQGKLDEAIKAFNRSLRINPNDASAWRNKGVVLREQGKSDAANECFERAKSLENK